MTTETTVTPDKFDYKDLETLERFLNGQGRLYSAKRTNLNARQQRKLKLAVKHARFLALLPYTN
jgi:small subunit ribosomal protein S18